jgi:hypothetical protein
VFTFRPDPAKGNSDDLGDDLFDFRRAIEN